MIGIGDAPLVIGPSELKEVLIKDPLNRDWVTIVECVSGDGRAISPLVVFGGKHVQHQWFEEEMLDDADLRDWKFALSGSGWSSNEIAIRWLREVFLPQTKPQKAS